ncbi:MAG: aminoacyl-tRNA hydrolase [Clostridia bacterium]|nr:aminoacyl-tRNA hydrolase [Clostridia bacterium]MBQ9514148.1 aminoacyl-tRNA hydrolase [Clostridia bacterium]
MKIIVGLGNPDDKYKNTFHNLGFMAVDKVAEELNLSFNKEKCRAKIAETKINGEKIVLVKPQTYMNLSGESIRELVAFYKTDTTDLLVFCDDFDIAEGEIRIRATGSGGTHNGLKNIVANLGTENFNRVKIGFKNLKRVNIPLIDLVLSGIRGEDKEIFDKVIDRAGKIGVDFAKGENIEKLMQKYNGKVC